VTKNRETRTERAAIEALVVVGAGAGYEEED